VCKHIQCPLLHFGRVWGLAATVLTPRGPENSQMSLRTRASAHKPIIAVLVPKEEGRRKGAKK
jgi:hypothetical protein